MGINNSELLEELMIKCHKEGIIDEVREEVRTIMRTDSTITQHDAYEMAYKRIKK